CLFGSCGGALCFFASVEESHCEMKLIAAAIAFRPCLVRVLAPPPSNGICEIRTTPQLGIALFPAQCPVAQALIDLRRLRLICRQVGEAVPLPDQAFMAEIEHRVFI